LIDNADLIHENSSPINFNGNDPVGLFKNGELIDIIGDFNGGDRSFAQDMTLRRKRAISKPNTRFDISEWDILPANTFDGIGSHSSTLSSKKDSFQAFKMFPNPVYGDQVNFIVNDAATITIYNVLGKLVSTSKITKNSNVVNISTLTSGIYLVKIQSEKQYIAKKLIKN
jgi:hypothetical protein